MRRVTPRGGWLRLAAALTLFALIPLVATARTPDGPRYIRSIGIAPSIGYVNAPRAVAVSPAEDGRIYVADSDNARIHVFSRSGQPIGTWGARGQGPGLFWHPTGVAVSPDGRYVYVVDQIQGVVQRFEPRPECFEYRSLGCFSGDNVLVFGDEGESVEALRAPSAAAVDSAGHVYVSDSGADNVQVFGADGRYVRTFGRTGSEIGQLNYPTSLVITPDGSVVVADRDNSRLAYFTDKGEAYTMYNMGGRLFHPTGLAIDHDGGLIVRDYDPSFGTPRLWRLDSERRLLWDRAIGGVPEEYGEPLQGVAVLPSGGLVLTDPTADEAALFIVEPDGQERVIALRGSAPKQFDGPRGVAIDEHFIVVADRGNRRVTVLNDRDRPVAIVGGLVDPDVELHSPSSVAVVRTGPNFNDARIYVADPGQHAVVVLSPSGDVIDRWGGVAGDAPDQFRSPEGVTVSLNGDVFVADTNNHRIVHRTYDGRVVNVFSGEKPGDLDFPMSVAMGPFGYMYVIEARKNRVQAFEPSGALAFKWVTEGNTQSTAPGDLWLPVAVEADDRFVYVLENNRRDHVRVQVFTSEKQYPENVFTIFASGAGADEGKLWDPMGMAVSADGRILIADSGNNRVQLFGWPDEAPIWIPSPSPTPTDPPFPTATPTATDTPIPSPTSTDLPVTATPEATLTPDEPDPPGTDVPTVEPGATGSPTATAQATDVASATVPPTVPAEPTSLVHRRIYMPVAVKR